MVDEYYFIFGCNLLEFLREKGYVVNAPCGGNGLCGKCTVLLRQGGQTREVFACKTVLTEPCEVYLPDDSGDISWNSPSGHLQPEAGRVGFGAAVDLGTATVALTLYDLQTGRELGSVSRWNAQKSFGADVISRAGFCMDNEGGLSRLSETIRTQILGMLEELCSREGISRGDVREVFLAGNTVMEHIFAGLSPASIALAPYNPASHFDKGEAVDLGGIPFYLSPCVAGYVGGDITAGLLTDAVHKAGNTFLFIDVGTNGEIVLGSESRYTSCAVASGPAFEGAGISCGMPAADGAVYSAEIISGEIFYRVIGGGQPKGICGSGLLDLAACLLELGYISESGRLNCSGEHVFHLTDSVYLTQKDVRQLQLAKAAVSAGITRLLESENIALSDISALYLAGGFGTRLRSESAVRTGMLPRELAGRIKPLGNTSLSGAATALLIPAKREELINIKNRCGYLELSADKAFNERFVEAMQFPGKA